MNIPSIPDDVLISILILLGKYNIYNLQISNKFLHNKIRSSKFLLKFIKRCDNKDLFIYIVNQNFYNFDNDSLYVSDILSNNTKSYINYIFDSNCIIFLKIKMDVFLKENDIFMEYGNISEKNIMKFMNCCLASLKDVMDKCYPGHNLTCDHHLFKILHKYNLNFLCNTELYFAEFTETYDIFDVANMKINEYLFKCKILNINESMTIEWITHEMNSFDEATYFNLNALIYLLRIILRYSTNVDYIKENFIGKYNEFIREFL